MRRNKIGKKKGKKNVVVSSTVAPTASKTTVKVSKPVTVSKPSTTQTTQNKPTYSTRPVVKKRNTQRRKRTRTSAIDPYGFFNIRASFKKGGPC